MNVTISFKGRRGAGKTALAEKVKAFLEREGFAVSDIEENPAHQRDRVIVQNPGKILRSA